jgi:hypothetical protein
MDQVPKIAGPLNKNELSAFNAVRGNGQNLLVSEEIALMLRPLLDVQQSRQHASSLPLS